MDSVPSLLVLFVLILFLIPILLILLLDDGRRPEIAELCRRLGVNYIDREDNRGAKAGNLNNALGRTSADFVATFDADHVPVSSFLAETLGHFRDARVAQVQSAHHFFNPDLFQDRLRSQEYIANEQDMFYHIVQPGRDVDNASFFCGSLVVMDGGTEAAVRADFPARCALLLTAVLWASSPSLACGLPARPVFAVVSLRPTPCAL